MSLVFLFQKRKPISKPDICGDDELLYPGDLDDDWVCFLVSLTVRIENQEL